MKNNLILFQLRLCLEEGMIVNMENSDLVLKDIEEFKLHVMKLSTQINKAGIEWKDEKFTQLYKGIQEIAKESRELIEVGEKCKKTINKFSSYNK